MAPIDVNCDSTHQWTPIGTSSNKYGGTFDGNGYQIGNVYIDVSSDGVGLFGYTDNASILNLTVEGLLIKGGSKVGGIVGSAASTRFLGCQNVANVTGTSMVGGIFGHTSNTGNCSVGRCANFGAITATENTALDGVGGIAGYSNYAIERCYNTGAISGNRNAGGILGVNYAACTVTQCFNVGNVTCSESTSRGGIVGLFNGSNESKHSKNFYKTGTAAKGIEGSSDVGAEPKSAEQLATESTYSDWNSFHYYWNMGNEYPILGDLWIGEQFTTVYDLNQGEGWNRYYSASACEITLDDFTLESDFAGIMYEGMLPLKITISGTNTITNSATNNNAYGVYSWFADVFIKDYYGEGSLTINTTQLNAETGGIAAPNITIQSGDITINTAESSSRNVGLDAQDSVTIETGKVTVNTTSGGATYNAAVKAETLAISPGITSVRLSAKDIAVDVTSTFVGMDGSGWTDSQGTQNEEAIEARTAAYTALDFEDFKCVEFAAATPYNLFIGGTEATSKRLSGTGWSYDPSTTTLTLEDYSFSDTVSDEHNYVKSAIYYGGEDTLTIEIKGSCVLMPYFSGVTQYGAGIYSENASLIIKGNGEMHIETEGTANAQYGIYTSDQYSKDLTIEGNPTIDVTCGVANNFSYGINTTNLTITGGEVTSVCGECDYGAGVFVAEDFTMSGGKLIAYGNMASDNIRGLYVSDNMTMTSGEVKAVALDSDTASSCGATIRYLSMTGGTFTAKGGASGNNESVGFEGLNEDSTATISNDITKFEVSGDDTATANISLQNSAPGSAWADKAGTGDAIELPANAGANLSAYKKILITHYDPPTPPGPTPPGPEPVPEDKRVDPESGVSVETSDGTAIPEDITLKVVVKTEVTAQEGKIDPAKVQEKISSKEKIAKVYDVKLIRIVGELEQEIQPSDIKDGMKVKVEIQLPKDIKTKGLRILHVHGDGTIDEINNPVITDGVAVVEVSSFSEFVLVTPKSHGFCIGWVAFILVILEMLATCLYTILRFGLLKELVAKCKLDGAYAKMDLLTLIGLCVAAAMFVFTLIALCVHQCTIAIISFIFAFIICGGFTFLFLEDKGITHLLPKKTEDKPQE